MTHPPTPDPGVPTFDPPTPSDQPTDDPAGYDPVGYDPARRAWPAEPAPATGPVSPDLAYAYPSLPAQVEPRAVVSLRERVGRGLAFSLLGIVAGAVASAVIYQAGFLASITSFLMAVAACWLYAKGAGSPPRAGAVPLVGVIIVGAVISLFAMLGLTIYNTLAEGYPDAAFGDIMPVVFDNLFYLPVWQEFATDALIFLAFAALGTFGTLRQLRRAAAAS